MKINNKMSMKGTFASFVVTVKNAGAIARKQAAGEKGVDSIRKNEILNSVKNGQ